MKKTDLQEVAYLVDDRTYGSIWNQTSDQVREQILGQLSDLVADKIWGQKYDRILTQLRDLYEKY